jgi:hypothetical protein
MNSPYWLWLRAFLFAPFDTVAKPLSAILPRPNSPRFGMLTSLSTLIFQIPTILFTSLSLQEEGETYVCIPLLVYTHSVEYQEGYVDIYGILCESARTDLVINNFLFLIWN